ncbi:MAG: ABC transporter permease [Anaerolineales bacterium]|nr:ABC transporter permease [Anaerolineales bacterium]
MIQLFRMAFRDLGRNRRRTFFSILALAMGLALLILMASFIHGEMDGAMDTTIQLQSGHLQLRAQNYDERKTSLKWEDLVENPTQVAEQISTLEPVIAASPRLFASGIVASSNQSAGVQIIGIDPDSVTNDPYREGVLSGEFLTPDDREGILIGRPLAEKMGLEVGDQINLTANTSNGDVSEQPFTIRGIYSTETRVFDSAIVFLPLEKAQAITRTEDHASTIFVLLKDKDQTDAVVSSLQTSLKILTWTKMNEVILQTENLSKTYMSLFYLIVLAVTATVIINTLIMAVFERTREIGIFAAIGMKGRRIMAMFLAESTILAVGGILLGLVLGFLVVAYLERNGFYVGNMAVGGGGFLIRDTVYPKFNLNDTINVSMLAFVVTLLAGLYPALLAARMEPIEALRAEK